MPACVKAMHTMWRSQEKRRIIAGSRLRELSNFKA
jgi:hypothetical protein